MAHLDQWTIGTNPKELSSSRARIFAATANRELTLAANEILSNGVEHSGQHQHVALSGDNQSFTVTISGGGIRRGIRTRPRQESGRGLQLAHALVDGLVIESGGGALVTKLVVYQ